MTRGVHDMGGLPAGPIDMAEHDHALWEKRVDALLGLLAGRKGLMTVDQLRRGIEILGEGAYDRMSYYERWMSSIATCLVDTGVVGTDELAAKLEDVSQREAAGALGQLRE